MMLLLWCFFKMHRNNWVYKVRLKMIDDDYETYHRLPSYDYMCDCWWIWDVKKFIDKKDPKADAAIER
jgi:hypothetical protein